MVDVPVTISSHVMPMPSVTAIAIGSGISTFLTTLCATLTVAAAARCEEPSSLSKSQGAGSPQPGMHVDRSPLWSWEAGTGSNGMRPFRSWTTVRLEASKTDGPATVIEPRAEAAVSVYEDAEEVRRRCTVCLN